MSEKRREPGQSWESAVEEQIREAMERGEFDNLKGKGKPQNFDVYHGDPATEMANHILQNAGFVPDWLELEREIEREQKEAEEHILRSWRWREAIRGDAIEDPRWTEAEWAKARALFEKRIKEINTKILTLNLQLPQPLAHKQRPRLNLELELRKLGIENG